jgi:radical SAM-linked protein
VAKPMPPRTSLPAAQHLVVRYAKRGKMRFASHRDVARAFERAVRRAGLPIAYSAGFTPHPKISYAGGAPTGVASEAEYLTLALTSPQEADLVRERLDAVLPGGIDVVDVTEAGPGGPAPEASVWQVMLPGVRPDVAASAAASFLAMTEAPVERLTDKGVRRLDARAAVREMVVLGSSADSADNSSGKPANGLSAELATGGARRAAVTSYEDCAILRMVVLHMAPAVRPEDILSALRAEQGLEPSSPPLTTRLAQLWPGQGRQVGRPEPRQLDGSRGVPIGKTLA